MKVYVAGASSELARVEAFIARVKAIPGVEISYDWTVDVRKAGKANEGMTLAQRSKAACACERGVLQCNVFVYLVPLPGHKSIGAAFEAGLAYRASAEAHCWER